MLLTKQELAHRAIETAERIGVDPAMVCAIIETETSWDASKREWNPTRWLLGVAPIDVGGDVNWVIMGTRWGPMQVLGQQALEAGLKDLEKLRTTDGSIEGGCIVLKSLGSNLARWFGAERKLLAKKASFLLPIMEEFVKSRPCVNT